MPRVQSCPEGELLQRLLSGELSLPEVESVASHLEKCGQCADTVQALGGTDTLAEALRAAARSTPPMEQEVVEGLQRRLKRLSAAARFASSEDTSALAPRRSPPLPAEEEESELLSGAGSDEDPTALLTPAQEKDELGRLGGYRVLRVLGTGGMGVVFEAEDPGLQRRVALKVMRPSLCGNDTAKKRFLAEARSVARVKSDHVITIYRIDEERGIAFAAMELLRGEPLDAWLKRGRKLSMPQLLRLGREMALGLQAAHEQGLVHRDVKPGNIWLEAPSGRVKLLDFGLARPIHSNVHLTQHGAIVGTPSYMAPEQARGEEVDHRADLFSLGCVLYRLLTGRLPFQGDTTMAILLALATQEPTHVLEVCPDAPLGLADLLMRLLSKDPAGRPESARAVVAELQALTQECKGPPAPSAVSVAFVPPPLPESPFAELTQPSSHTVPARGKTAIKPAAARRPPPPRGRVVALIAAGCAALGLLVAGVVLLVPTKNGTIRVEINDDAIEATVTTKGVKIKGSGKEDVRVEPGEHGLKVQRGDLVFETTKFAVRKGETVALKVEYLPGKVRVVQGNKVLGEKALPRPAEKKDEGPDVVEKKPEAKPVEAPPDLPFKLTPGDFALRIDGEGKVVVPALPMDLSKPFTIEMYFVMIGKPTEARWVLSSGGAAGVKGGGGDDHRFLSLEISVWRRPPTLSYQPLWPRRAEPQAGAFLVPENKRFHVAAIHDGGEVRLYVNGKLNGKGTNAQLPAGERKQPFSLAANGFCGLIDEVRISRGARYDKDFTPAPRHKRDKDTLALYHCDEGKGDALKDDSGHGRDLRFTGARWVNADGTEIKPAANQRGIAAQLLDRVQQIRLDMEVAGGEVVGAERSRDLPGGPFEVVTLTMHAHPRRPSADADLATLAELTSLERVGLTQGAGTAAVVRLAGLPRLRYLGLAYSDVDTRAIPAVRRMQSLEVLQMPPRHADRWVEGLAGHPALREIQFYRGDVTGKNLSALSKLPRLREVTIADCGSVTPHLFAQLAQVRQLEKVSLWKLGPVVTPEALAQLRKALPKCAVRAE